MSITIIIMASEYFIDHHCEYFFFCERCVNEIERKKATTNIAQPYQDGARGENLRPKIATMAAGQRTRTAPDGQTRRDGGASNWRFFTLLVAFFLFVAFRGWKTLSKTILCLFILFVAFRGWKTLSKTFFGIFCTLMVWFSSRDSFWLIDDWWWFFDWLFFDWLIRPP